MKRETSKMGWLLVLVIAVGAWPALAQAESIPDAVRRLDAMVQELERRGVGERGPQGPAGPPGSKGEPGQDATLDDIKQLHIGGKRGVELGIGVENGGYLKLRNNSGRVSARVATTSNSGYLMLYDRSGAGRANVGIDSGDNGFLVLLNGNGKHVITLGSYTSGNGYVQVNGKNVNDYAEVLDLATRDGISPGSVVAYDSGAGGLVPASASNAGRVVGVISGAGGFSPGMVIGSRVDESTDLPVSMAGVVHVRVSAEAGAVEPGDLLVPSSVAGVGMRTADPGGAFGTIFGKALEPWSGTGEGLVKMLVMNR